MIRRTTDDILVGWFDGVVILEIIDLKSQAPVIASFFLLARGIISKSVL